MPRYSTVRPVRPMRRPVPGQAIQATHKPSRRKTSTITKWVIGWLLFAVVMGLFVAVSDYYNKASLGDAAVWFILMAGVTIILPVLFVLFLVSNLLSIIFSYKPENKTVEELFRYILTPDDKD